MRQTAPVVIALAVTLIILNSLTASGLRGQTFVTPRGEAQNVRFEQGDHGVITIFYDLVSTEPNAVFAVTLDASQDGGETFAMKPRTMSGDVGFEVRPGPGKRIVWESAKDVERVQIDRFRFRIIATGAPLRAEPEAPVPSNTSANTSPKPVTPAQQPQASRRINPLVWVGAAGGAAAIGLAVAGGGSTPPTPTGSSSTSTSTPSPTIAGSWSGTVATSPTVPFGGSGYCNYTVTLSNVQLSFDVDASFVASNVQLRQTASEQAIVCPFQPYPPNQHTYQLTGQQSSPGAVILNLANTSGAPANTAEISASLDSPNALSARFTFQRSLQPGEEQAIGWRVTFTSNLARTR